MPKITIQMDSNMLDTPAIYDPEAQTLQLTFKNNKKTYTYHPVSMEMFSEFEKASSRGSFFLRRIKNNSDIKAALVEEKKREDLPHGVWCTCGHVSGQHGVNPPHLCATGGIDGCVNGCTGFVAKEQIEQESIQEAHF